MSQLLHNVCLELTTDCNLACRYCYNIWKRPLHSARFNSYKSAINTLTKLFAIADVKNIAFTGGEPFMSERFSEVVLFSRLKQKNVIIITNGNTADKKAYKTMIKLGVSAFEIPMHAKEPNIHDYLTTCKGSWKKVWKSIETIHLQGGYVIPVIVLTKANFEHIEETLDFLSQAGLKRIMLNRYNIGGNGIKEHANLRMTHSELKKSFKIANDIADRLNLTLTSNVCTPWCVLNPFEYPNITFGNCPADVAYRPITIDIFGNVRLCNHSPVKAGNIFTEPIEDIIYSEYAKSWTKTKPAYCNTCNLFADCMGGCRAASEQLNLSLNHEDPIIKELYTKKITVQSIN